MIDLEREVREALERRAEEAAGRAAQRLPASARRRIRRREVATVLAAGVAAAALGVAAFAGVQPFLRSTGLQPGAEITPSETPSPSQTYVVLTRGEIEGKAWKLSVRHRADGEWCTRVEVEDGASGGCGPWEPRGGFNISLAHHRGYPVGFFTGEVSKDVGRVVLQLESGDEIEPEILEPPASLGAPFNIFIALVPKQPQAITILGFDRSGNLFHQAGIEPANSAESSSFFEAQDVYGNVVGYLRGRDYILGEEWAEPGTRATMERIESIRHVATFPLQDISPEVRAWWERRPQPEAQDDAFLDWWASYPVTD